MEVEDDSGKFSDMFGLDGSKQETLSLCFFCGFAEVRLDSDD